MRNDDRGIITYRKRAQQIIDYSGLRFGNITPTDVDGFIDYHGECFVLIEFKFRDKELPPAQKHALVALADSADRPTMIIVAEHYVEDTEQDIPAGDCKVRESYVKGIGWRKSSRTVRELVKHGWSTWRDTAATARER